MLLTDRPTLFPATTLFGNAGGPVVDTAVEHPGGRVYIDRVEAGEIARLFGFAKPEDLETVRRRNRELEATIADLQQRLARAAAAVTAEAA